MIFFLKRTEGKQEKFAHCISFTVSLELIKIGEDTWYLVD
jgi:hypothetical protein